MAFLVIKLILAAAVIYAVTETFRYFSYWGLGIDIIVMLTAAAAALLWFLAAFFIKHRARIKLLAEKLSGRIKSSARWRTFAERIKQKWPRLYQFILDRADPAKPNGRGLSIGLLIAALFFFFFLSIVQDVIFKDPLYFADLRVIYLLRTVTSENLSRFFAFFTALAQPLVITSGVILAGAYLISIREKLAAKYLVATALVGALFSLLTKIILQRPRPFDANLIAPPHSYSLPSGHAIMAFCFYGFIAYLLFGKFKNRFSKVAVLVLFFLMALLIGLSRVYLGIHYPSDVLAGWYLGFSILAVGVTFMKIEKKFFPGANEKKSSGKMLPATLAILFCVIVFFSYGQIQIINPSISSTETNLTGFISRSSLYSEDLFGKKMEPISFIVIGDQKQIINLFGSAGWSLAEQPHFKNFLKLSSAIAQNINYPTAPMTPSFYASKTNDLGFEKSTDLDTARQRHHTRYWRTGYKIGGEDVWVATASFDRGVKIGPVIQLPVHRIDPDIDAEREFIMNDFLKTGLVSDYQKINLVGPVEGTNAADDNFTTDGQAYVIYL